MKKKFQDTLLLLLALIAKIKSKQKAENSEQTKPGQFIVRYLDPASKLCGVTSTTPSSQHVILYFDEGGSLELKRNGRSVSFISSNIPDSLKDRIVRVTASPDRNPKHFTYLEEFTLSEGSDIILGTEVGPYIFFVVEGATGDFNID